MHSPYAPAKSKRRFIWPIISGVLIAGLAGLSGYLWMIHSQWVDQNEQLRAEASALGEAYAQEQAALLESEAQLVTVRSQLETATERISDIAGIEANAVDDRAYLVDLAEAYDQCVASLKDHIRVLIDPNWGYDGQSTSSVRADIYEYCDSLSDDFDTFRDDRG